MIAPRSPTKSPGMNRRAVACHPTVKQLEKGTLSALRTGFGMAFVSLYLGYKLRVWRLPSILWLDRSVRMGSPPPALPRMSNVGPTPRPVKSAIRHKANNGRSSLSRAIGPARRRAVRAKGINCYGDIGHEGATLRPNTRYVPAVMMSDDGPIGHECLCCVGAGQQQRNCRCHQPNQ